MNELLSTYGNFSLRGIVVGLHSDRYYTEGEKDKGNSWRRLWFGVKVGNTSFIYVELMGSKTKHIKAIYRNPSTNKLDKSKIQQIDWNARDNLPLNYKIHMPIRINLKKSESQELVVYDAVDYIKHNLNDGDSVYINGSLQYQEYQDKVQEKFVIQEIGTLNETLGVHEVIEQEAFFTQEIVFIDIQKNESKQQHLINSLIVNKKDNLTYTIPYTYVINYGKYIDSANETKIKEVIRMFEDDITYGSTVRVFGDINHLVETMVIDGCPVVTGSSIKEFEITGGSIKSVVKDRYTESQLTNAETNDPFVYVEDEVFKSEPELAF